MNHPSSGIEDHPDGSGNLNGIINGNWQTADAWFNPAQGKTIRQDNGTPGTAGTVLTASVDLFTADMAGATIRFADGSDVVIASVTTSTVAVGVGSGQSVAAQAAELYQLTMTAAQALMRGLTKRTAFASGDANKFLQWNQTLGRAQLVYPGGTDITAGYVLFGGGTGLGPAGVTELFWNNSTKQLDVTGYIHATKVIYSDVVTASPTTSVTPDFGLSNNFDYSLTGALTVAAPTNGKVGAKYRFVIRQDATGGRLITWNAAFKFPASCPMALKNGSNAITSLEFLATASGELINTACNDYGTPTVRSIIIEQSVLTYAGSTAIDFLTEGYRTVSLTGNITFTTSNRAAGRGIVLRIICDSTIRNFTFPAWKWVGGSVPANIAASKTGILTLTVWGTADTDIVASWTVEP